MWGVLRGDGGDGPGGTGTEIRWWGDYPWRKPAFHEVRRQVRCRARRLSGSCRCRLAELLLAQAPAPVADEGDPPTVEPALADEVPAQRLHLAGLARDPDVRVLGGRQSGGPQGV